MFRTVRQRHLGDVATSVRRLVYHFFMRSHLGPRDASMYIPGGDAALRVMVIR